MSAQIVNITAHHRAGWQIHVRLNEADPREQLSLVLLTVAAIRLAFVQLATGY